MKLPSVAWDESCGCSVAARFNQSGKSRLSLITWTTGFSGGGAGDVPPPSAAAPAKAKLWVSWAVGACITVPPHEEQNAA